MTDGKTHFADNDTLDYIAKLERELSKAQAENATLGKNCGHLSKEIYEVRQRNEKLAELLPKNMTAFNKMTGRAVAAEAKVEYYEACSTGALKKRIDDLVEAGERP